MRVQKGRLGVRGLTHGKIFRDQTLQIVGKRPIFGEFCHERANDHDCIELYPIVIVSIVEMHRIKSDSLINFGSFLIYR